MNQLRVKWELEEIINNIFKDGKGHWISEIVSKTGLSILNIQNILKEMVEKGKLKKRLVGMSKRVYFLTDSKAD